MHYVGRVAWSFADSALPETESIHGASRRVLVGAEQGAVHTELAAGILQPGGYLGRHVHSYEEALYVLEGELLMQVAENVWRLHPGDYTLQPIGVPHGIANASDTEVRWVSVNTPHRLDPAGDRQDTFFEPGPTSVEALDAAAVRPPFGDPRLRWVGHYDGTPPQAEALALPDPARGRAPAGMDTALLAYSGISVRMLVDRTFGADLLTLFTVDYEVGGSAQQHDHPFEETYFFLAGEVEAELDGEIHRLKPGDVVFAGVGSVHGFYNVGTERVRWLETQAPQPPVRHAYRWVDQWKRLESG